MKKNLIYTHSYDETDTEWLAEDIMTLFILREQHLLTDYFRRCTDLLVLPL